MKKTTRIISVSIQKGGTGKTTTADALLAIAAAAGLKTLALDLDAQGNLSGVYQADGTRKGSYSLLTGTPAADLIQHTARGDIIAAEYALAAADIQLAKIPGGKRDFLLKDAIQPIKEDYDLIIIDTAPSLNTLLINALAASTEVLIPVQADIYSLESLYQLLQTVGQIKQYCNADLSFTGVFVTRYSARSVLSKDMREALRLKCEENKIPFLQTVIRESVAVKEAAATRQAITDYSPRSNPAADYRKLAAEINLI